MQDPDDPQNLNRYSYVLNSPQNYVDPSGYDWDFFSAFFSSVGSFFSSFSASSYQSQVSQAQQNNAFTAQTFNNPDLCSSGACGGNYSYFMTLYNCSAGPCQGAMFGGPENIGAEAAMIVATLNGEGDVPRSFGGPSPFARAPGAKPVDEFIRDAQEAASIDSAAGRIAKDIANPIPKAFARVVPGNVSSKTLGRIDDNDVFVTDANAVKGLNSNQIAKALGILHSPTGFKVIEFSSEGISGIASPINRSNPGFVGGGRTSGGAPEYVIPNGPVPEGATVRFVP